MIVKKKKCDIYIYITGIQLLIEFCGKHGLLTGGTVFPHRDCHKVTWISPDKGKQVANQIDYICISRNWNKSFLDVRNKRGADIRSDHMIMGILRIKVQRVTRKVTNRKKYKLRKLEDSDCQRTVKAKLREGASSIRCKVPEDIE
jgi:hypothetical protein